jgi:hypothetical protein
VTSGSALTLAIVPGNHLPDDRVLPLAVRTMALHHRKTHTVGMIWSRLAVLGTLDVKAGIDMADNLIRRERGAEWPVFDFNDVAPLLRLGLASTEPTVRTRTERLVDDLGDRGWTEFGTLRGKKMEALS